MFPMFAPTLERYTPPTLNGRFISPIGPATAFGESPLSRAREDIALGVVVERIVAELLASKAPEDSR